MITLITYPPAFGEPAPSPFCVKAMYLLNASGFQWQRQDTKDPRKWPSGKLPAISVDGQVIGDSDNIRAYLEAKGADFDAGLSDIDKATSRAFIRMAEEHIYFHILLDRWDNEAVWPLIRDTYFNEMPKFIRGTIAGSIRRNVVKGMHAQGLGRLTAEERLARLEPDLQAIATRLWQGPFLFGQTATAADASVGAMLRGGRSTPVETPLSRRIADDTILSEYTDRVAEQMG